MDYKTSPFPTIDKLNEASASGRVNIVTTVITIEDKVANRTTSEVTPSSKRMHAHFGIPHYKFAYIGSAGG